MALRNGPRVSGADTARLILAGVTPDDAGTYTVLVSDGLGVVGSDPAELVVEGEPVTVRLAVQRLANGNVRLSWPVEAAGFVLQTTTALPGGWVNSQAAVISEGDQFVVLLVPPDQARYFRSGRALSRVQHPASRFRRFLSAGPAGTVPAPRGIERPGKQ